MKEMPTLLPPPSPVIANLPYPKEIQKEIDKFEALWSKWAEADTELHGAKDDLRDAAYLDKEALIAAVRAGEPDPGEVHTYKAERQVLYTYEAARMIRAEVSKAAESLTALLKENSRLIARLAIEEARTGVEKWGAAVTAASQLLSKAARERNEALEGLSMAASLPLPVRYQANFPMDDYRMPSATDYRVSRLCDSLERHLDVAEAVGSVSQVTFEDDVEYEAKLQKRQARKPKTELIEF